MRFTDTRATNLKQFALCLLISIAALMLEVRSVAADEGSAAPGPDADYYVALVIGDSISAAYGLNEQDGWVYLAEQALRDRGHPVRMVNASISGDTTAGGLRRLPDALERFDPDLVILELGGNDGLRGYPTRAMQQNLEQMAQLSTEHGAQVLILGMMIPSNYGQAYLNMFARAFEAAAQNTGSAFIPFLLEPIALDRNFFLPDGIHPNAEAQPLMVDHVLPTLLDLLETAEAL